MCGTIVFKTFTFDHLAGTKPKYGADKFGESKSEASIRTNGNGIGSCILYIKLK